MRSMEGLGTCCRKGVDDMKININDIQTYLKQIGEYNILTDEEEKNLFQELKAGNVAAREEIIQRNLKLVVAIAKR